MDRVDTKALLAGVDLLALLARDTPLQRVARTDGGEYAGPCPACGGRDRFRVWPAPREGPGRYWCRQCGARGDAISYLRWREGLGFQGGLRAAGRAAAGGGTPRAGCGAAAASRRRPAAGGVAGARCRW
ncbi:MAG: hypothetical protein M5R40_20460 [Anaerolineae bacterium]|nr:hypothetical protein [Anaerolineae bacterium]